MRSIEGRPEIVIFDNDCTLVDTSDISYRAANHVWRKYGCPTMTFEEFCRGHRQPFISFLRERGIPAEVPDQEIWNVFREVFAGPGGREITGVRKLIEWFYNRETTLVVISASSVDITRMRLGNTRLGQYFSSVRGGEDSKVEHIYRLCLKHQAEPAQVWFIGDTCSDMRDAKEAGVIPIGIQSVFSKTCEDLLKAGAIEAFPNYRAMEADLLPRVK